MGEHLYHHGDLKKELIRKGIQLLNKEGYEGFSLRKLAAMCNVSHAAPYRHFKNKEELHRAINLEISTKFRDALFQGMERYPDDPKTRLLELCTRYISFMVENPDYFRYIFMTVRESRISVSEKDILLADGEHPFAISMKYAKDYFCSFPNKENDWTFDFLSLWSQIHGLTLLLVNKTIDLKGGYINYAGRMIGTYLDSYEKSNLLKR
jgi:AcrR family transcriptional regulator